MKNRNVRAADPPHDKPFVRTLTVRYFAGCYDETEIPENLNRDDAVKWAQQFLRERWKGRFKGCLAHPRTELVWFEKDGTYKITNDLPKPSMSIRGKKFVLRGGRPVAF